MTKFNEIKTKELKLPDSSALVVVRDTLTFGTSLEMLDYENEKDAQLFMIKEMVVSWDFIGKDNKPVPLTIENIKLLSPGDGRFLVTEVTKFFTEDKKKD